MVRRVLKLKCKGNSLVECPRRRFCQLLEDNEGKELARNSEGKDWRFLSMNLHKVAQC
jgi:hypothetical protein